MTIKCDYITWKELVKTHMEHWPLPFLLCWSWSVLPVIYKLSIIVYCAGLLFYDLWHWRYKQWGEQDVSQCQRTTAKVLHWALLSVLIIPPMICIAAFQCQHIFPVWIDNAVLTSIADKQITNAVTRYEFTIGPLHPTNYSTSYIGVADITGAHLFQTSSLFNHATSTIMDYVKDGVIVFLLFEIVGFLCLFIYEAFVDSFPKTSSTTHNVS
jgi:hypothetical protein